MEYIPYGVHFMLFDNIILEKKDNQFHFVYSHFYDTDDGNEYFIMDVFNSELKINKSIHFKGNSNINKLWIENFITKIINDNSFLKYFRSLPDSLDKNDIKEIESNNIKIKKDILNIINLENRKKAKFKDYVNLKSGFDEFSKLKKNDLLAKFPNFILNEIKMSLITEKEQLSALRWICRGLPENMAIHKVKVDMEISKNANKYKKQT